MAFPTDPLEIKAEIALGADVTGNPALWSWTDISAYVRTADGTKVKINRGRRNDSGSVSPATATFDLNNADGRFCTQLPTSPYYPLLAVNTPVRLSVSTDSGGSWSTRFSGYLSGLPTSWRGPGGSDSWVSVTADSIIRRLAEEPSRTPMRGTAPNLALGRCIEYWPMEDLKTATQAASVFADGIPMTAGGSIEMGASSPPSGSAATPQSDYAFMAANPPSLSGVVRPYTDTGEWSAVGMFKVDAESVVEQVLVDCDINHGESSVDPDQLRLVIDGNVLSLRAYREDETLMGSNTTAALTPAPNDGDWHAFGITANQSGADIDFKVRYEGNSYSFTVTNRTLGTVRRVTFPSTSITTEAELLAVGHLAVYDDFLSTTAIDEYASSMNSHVTSSGERVDLRLSRLAGESDLIDSIGTIPGETAMWERAGSQSDGNTLSAINDAAEADGGILYEPKDVDDDSLTYLSRSALNVHATDTPSLTLTQDDFSILGQGDDDHYLATKVTVSGAGSSATATREPAQNEVSYTQNVRFPDRLPDLAGWALYQGTRRDYRYPRIQILMHGATGQIAAWKSTELGDRILITDPPPGVVDDIDLLLEGYQESMDQYTWTVELYCSPASRYRIAQLDHTDYGRMDSAGSRLVNALTSSATTFDVETYEGPEWTTSAGFDIGIGGERMTTTVIENAFRDTFTRTESNGWGTSTSGHAWTDTGGAASDYSVNGSRGLISINAVNSLRSVYATGLQVADIDRTFTVRIPVLATGAGILVRHAARWNVGSGDYLAAALQVETSQAVTAGLNVVIGGSLTTVWSIPVVGLTHTTTRDFGLRFKLAGPRMFVKIWDRNLTEPPQWTLSAYDTQVTAAGVFGIRARLNSGNTNALPVVLQFDGDATVNPQKFTVTRSVNTVVKSHAAAAPVGLFQPNYLGL